MSILVELQAQAAAGSCSPATRRKGMKAVMWRWIDSRHNLFLSALAQCIVLHRGARRLSKRLPATFYAIMLCNATTSLQPHCLVISETASFLFEPICCLAVWSQVDGLCLCASGGILAVTCAYVERFWCILTYLKGT